MCRCLIVVCARLCGVRTGRGLPCARCSRFVALGAIAWGYHKGVVMLCGS